jgi:hypothetical protein
MCACLVCVCVCTRVRSSTCSHNSSWHYDTIKLFTYKTKREMRSGCHEPITLTCQDLNSRLACAEKRPPSFQHGYRSGQDSNSVRCRGLSHSSPRLSPSLSLPPSLPLPVSLSFKTPSPFSPFPPSYQVFPELFFLVYDSERHVHLFVLLFWKKFHSPRPNNSVLHSTSSFYPFWSPPPPFQLHLSRPFFLFCFFRVAV